MGAPAAQAASENPEAEDSANSIEVPMHVTDYDTELAEDNGFRIEFSEDGTPYSVPVTEEAKQEFTEANNGENVSPQGTVTGGCGTSHLYATPAGSSTALQIETGYDIFPALGSPINHVWNVDGSTQSGAFTENFSGLAPLGQSWTASHTINVGTNISGFAEIRSDSGTWTSYGLFCGVEQNADQW